MQWQRTGILYRTPYRLGNSQRLGLALKKPLVAVPTVDALAYNLYDAQGLICPIMDAREAGIYRNYRFEEHQLMTLKEQWAVTDRGTAGRTESERRDGTFWETVYLLIS